MTSEKWVRQLSDFKGACSSEPVTKEDILCVVNSVTDVPASGSGHCLLGSGNTWSPGIQSREALTTYLGQMKDLPALPPAQWVREVFISPGKLFHFPATCSDSSLLNDCSSIWLFFFHTHLSPNFSFFKKFKKFITPEARTREWAGD